MLQRKGGKGYFSWSKKKSDDVKNELKTFKEIACAQEGIMAEILTVLKSACMHKPTLEQRATQGKVQAYTT